jgi:type II secretory ATPase GspE/PulE/Tfp pilus assembly ATPase PilB-like protein
MSNITQLLLGETLVKHGVIPQSALDEAMKVYNQTAEPVMMILSRLYPAKEDKILKVISAEFTIPLIKMRGIKIDNALIKKIPVKFVAHYKFIPLKLEGNILTTITPVPYDLRTMDEMRMHMGFEIAMVLASRLEVMEAVKKYYGLAADTIEKIMMQSSRISITTDISSEKVDEIEKLTEDASVIKLVNQIILEAHKGRATDIHIEPYRGKIRLRYRVDGILFDANVPPAAKSLFPAIISRIKIMSNLNIVERRLPQDGRYVGKMESGTLDMRISIIPTPYGESVVIRLLPTDMLYNLSDLGLGASDLRSLEGLLEKPHGIIFVTGPTGSGKTTTLYASLHKLNNDDVKIITIEDPVEYEMEGITQIQVNNDIDLTFARGLRSILRHDPDIIMVGEVRDFETAEITIRLSLTGHLVFSTIHTNDAPGGVARLIDMGVEPYLITSTVEAFIAQRLVRVICPECREIDTDALPELKAQIARELGVKEVKIYKGKGCDSCNFTGYKGRTALYEIMFMNEALRKIILTKASSDEIKRTALKSGMKTLRYDGWNKVNMGMTTPEEVMRVTPAEEIVGEAMRASSSISFSSTLSAPQASVKNPPVQPVSSHSNESGKKPPAEPTEAEPKKEPLVQQVSGERTYQRLRTRIPIEYTLYKEALDGEPKFDYPVKTIIKDISAGGISFETKDLLGVGNVLKFKIEVPDYHKKIDCMMKIIRIEEVKGTNRYNVAAYYLDIASDDKSILDQFIQHNITT